MFIRSVSQEFSLNTYFALALACFVIGMLNFAVACDFNVFQMVHYLGQERWSAPWGRGQLGGWDAFLDHLQYFGYLLPILSVVIARRAGLRNPRTLICIAMSIVMTLFLAQRQPPGDWRGRGHGARVVGTGPTAIRIKHLLGTVFAIVALLVTLQIMLEYRNVGLGALVGKTDTSLDSRTESDSYWKCSTCALTTISIVFARSFNSSRSAPVRLSPLCGLRDGASGAARVLAGETGRSGI